MGHVEDQAVESRLEQLLGLLRDAVGTTHDEHAAHVLLVDPGALEHLLEGALGLGIGLADEEAAQTGLDDRARIAANRLAMPVEDIHFVAHHVSVAEDVAHVGVLRDQFQRALLAATADHDWRAVRLDGPRGVDRAMNLVVPPLEARRFLAEHCAANL